MIDKIDNLIKLFKLFPGVGEKSAKRMAYFLLNQDESVIDNFSEVIKDLKNINKCSICGIYTENEICTFCESRVRDNSKICVVEEFNDVEAIESTGVYGGLYHILGGHVSPVEGVFLEDLNIKSLFDRMDGVDEIILATNPNLEGQATANYLSDELKKYDVKITRLATGLPMGGDLSILNTTTIKNSLQNRFDSD